MMKTTLRLCLAAATAALLTACDGGSDPAPLPTVPTETVPDSATASVSSYTEFVGSLINQVQGSDTAQPLLLNAAEAPTSESALPVTIM